MLFYITSVLLFIVGIGLLILSIATSPTTVGSDSSDDSAQPTSSTTSSSSQTASNSFGWGNGLVALLILGIIGGGIWWVSTLPTSSSHTVSGLVYEDNSEKFVTFDVPKKWQQNSCFSLDSIINAKVVTIAGVDEVIKVAPTNGRCWSGEKRVRHVTFRLADKSVSRVSVTFEKK
jgi:hypothetical protein